MRMASVALITVTPDAEELLVYMARVSNPVNQGVGQRSERLIQYLIDHKHWSPFEMVHMVLQIETTRSVAAQILRHRSFSFQEFSQRYADTNLLGSARAPHLRRQDNSNRQNSIDDLTADKTQIFYRRINQHFEEAQDLYREMVSMGVAKECARDVLPLSTPTKLYMNGTLRSWLHYTALRCANGTQYEHQLIATGVKHLLIQQFPLVSEAMWSGERSEPVKK